MPDDRFLHKRAGRSDKVTMLSDTEYRVWTQYLLSADDFGVMRCSPLSFQDDNDSLAMRQQSVIEEALQKILAVGLLRAFEHQRRIFLYQHDWQTWQKIVFPRKTNEPIPPVKYCDRETQWLISHHPGAKRLSSWQAPKTFTCEVVAVLPENFGRTPGEVQENFEAPLAVSRLPLAKKPRAATPEHVATTATPDSAEKAPSRVREFLVWFQSEYKARRNGAVYFVKWEAHGKLVKDLLKAHSFERLQMHAKLLLTTNEEWTSGTDRGIGILSSRISWLEDRLCEWEAKRRAREAV